MEEGLIRISEINDFIFCPISIYFHKLMGNLDTIYYHTEKQIQGSHVHEIIDHNKYSTSKNIITSMDVYSDEYGLVGKIDIYNMETGELIERKKHVNKIYDGYIFQLYAQYFALIEMGYEVKKISIISHDDNKKYNINLPHKNLEYLQKFKDTIFNIKTFKMDLYKQTNVEKCKNCIYECINQISEKDFKVMNKKYILKWENNKKYVQIFSQAINEYNEDIFMFIQKFYRSYVKGKDISQYEKFIF